MLVFVVMWINLKSIMWSERKQKQRQTHSPIPFILHSRKYNPTYGDREQSRGLIVAWGPKGREGELVEGSRETHEGKRYVCYLDCSDGFTVTYVIQNRSNCLPHTCMQFSKLQSLLHNVEKLGIPLWKTLEMDVRDKEF